MPVVADKHAPLAVREARRVAMPAARTTCSRSGALLPQMFLREIVISSIRCPEGSGESGGGKRGWNSEGSLAEQLEDPVHGHPKPLKFLPLL